MSRMFSRHERRIGAATFVIGVILGSFLNAFYRFERLPELQQSASAGTRVLSAPMAVLACLMIGLALGLWMVLLWQARHRLRPLFAPKPGKVLATVGLWLCLSLPVFGWVPVANAIALMWPFVATAPVAALLQFVLFEVSLLLLTYILVAPIMSALGKPLLQFIALALIWWAVYLGGPLVTGLTASPL